MTMWIAASLDERLGKFHNKKDALNAVLLRICLPFKSRRIAPGLYEITTAAASSYWIMTEQKAKFNGFE